MCQAVDGTHGTSERDTMNMKNKDEVSKWNFWGWKMQFQVGEGDILTHKESDPSGLWKNRGTSSTDRGE